MVTSSGYELAVLDDAIPAATLAREPYAVKSKPLAEQAQLVTDRFMAALWADRGVLLTAMD